MARKRGERTLMIIKAIEGQLLKTGIPIKLRDWCNKNKKFLLITLNFVSIESAISSVVHKFKKDPGCSKIIIGPFYWINLKKGKK